MKKSILVFSLVMAGAFSALGLVDLSTRHAATAQAAAAPAVFSSSLGVTWDHTGKDTAGNTETLATGEVGLFAAGVDPNVAKIPLASVKGLPAQPGTAYQPVGTVLFPPSRPQGTYQIAVRVSDTAGNVSAWSPTITGILDNISPAAPGLPRMQIVINIGG